MGSLDFVQRLPLFTDLTEREFEMLKAFIGARRLEPGQALFEEGDGGSACFIITHGTAEIHKRLADGQQHLLAELGPGDMIGEVSLLDGKPRSASCRAGSQPLFMVELRRDEFERLFQANNRFAFKIVDRVAMDLVARLREATTRLSEVSAQELEARTPEARACAQAVAEALDGPSTFKIEVNLDDATLDDIEVVAPRDDDD